MPRPSLSTPAVADKPDSGRDLRLDFASFVHLRKLMEFNTKASPRSVLSSLASQIAIYLPDVAKRIDESDFGYPHLEIGVLKLATREAIDRRDWATAALHFAFVEHLWLHNTGTDLRDAIRVSYLSAIFDGESELNHEKAKQLLPPVLREILRSGER